MTPKYTKGHCVILGDAAFATMGIGTSLAMTGAYCIAGELSKIESASQAPNALQKYEDLVRPDCMGGLGLPNGTQDRHSLKDTAADDALLRRGWQGGMDGARLRLVAERSMSVT